MRFFAIHPFNSNNNKIIIFNGRVFSYTVVYKMVVL